MPESADLARCADQRGDLPLDKERLSIASSRGDCQMASLTASSLIVGTGRLAIGT